MTAQAARAHGRRPTELERVSEDLRTAKASRRQMDRHIAKLERRRDELRGQGRKARPSEQLDPHSQAGPKNVELMREVFKEGRVLTAAEATTRSGSEPGHQVWAIRALVSEGQIEETGRKVGVSKEYRWVGKRRRTRMKPGS